MVDTHGFLRAEVADLVAQMTTGEKIDLLSGKNFWE
jgi:hypothetical protein